MKRHILTLGITALILAPLGCVPMNLSSMSSGTEGLVNYALAENGATVEVCSDNPEHPASTLINGITLSDNWGAGEGWEHAFSKVHVKRRTSG